MRRAVLLLATMSLVVLAAGGVALAVTKVGTDGPDTLRGTNGADNLIGKGGNDKLIALRGRDNLIGGPGKDFVIGYSRGDKNLVGGSGNDAVIGSKGSDNILGQEGNDFLAGDPAREAWYDNISGGDGNDVFFTVNQPGGKDVVVCAGGFDRVFADRKDVLTPDCERVAHGRDEFEKLFDTIPQSFWEGLHPDFG
jgi:Ca2+-binding RTX toxin-like protein